MNKTRLVTFTPSDAFFFGGETTFGNGDSRNFHAASNTFPQQTTLVGVLRHALFEAGYPQNIGNSFMVNAKPDFGDLEKLSPVFIYRKSTEGEDFALPVRLPKINEKESIKINFSVSEKIEEYLHKELPSDKETEKKSTSPFEVNLGYGWQPAPVVAKYKEKHGIESLLLFSNDNEPLKSYDEVFEEITKTGIARDRIKHTTLDSMFYQQTLFKFKNGYSFGVFVTGTEELFKILDNRNMPIGGEKMNFVIQVSDCNQSFEELFHQAFLDNCIEKAADWVLLTSDAFVDSNIYKECHLAISETQSFRNIITPDSNKYIDGLLMPDGEKKQKEAYENNLKLVKHNRKRYKSEKFTLLKRGTVLFPRKGKLSDITNKLQNVNFQKIGYNHYFTNQKTS